MNNVKELKIWQKAMEITSGAYALAAALPICERYGLRSQLCRCAVSVPSTIAEGAGRNSEKEFAQFLGIASGSLYELETQILISIHLFLIDEKDTRTVLSKVEELHKMLYAFKKSLRTKIQTQKTKI